MHAGGMAAVPEFFEPRFRGRVRKFRRRNGKEQAFGDGEAVFVGTGEQGDPEGGGAFRGFLEDEEHRGFSVDVPGDGAVLPVLRAQGVLQLNAVAVQGGSITGGADLQRHPLRAGLVGIGVVARFRDEPEHGHGGIFVHRRRELPSVHGGKFRPFSMEAVGQGLCRRSRACAKEGEGTRRYIAKDGGTTLFIGGNLNFFQEKGKIFLDG